jgi:glycosyltransferase involved in cell wall biosynthesis
VDVIIGVNTVVTKGTPPDTTPAGTKILLEEEKVGKFNYSSELKNVTIHPYFSVIMPCYKTSGSVLTKAIDSVLSQTFEDYEIICINDDENDDYREDFSQIAESYGDRSNLHFLSHKCNLGANAARNDAILASSGEWLAFLDADDYWDAEYLKTAYEKSVEGNYAIISTPIRIIKAKSTRYMHFHHANGNIYNEELHGDILSPSSGICVRKEALLAVGGFDNSLPARQDYDMWLRMCEHFEVAFCSDIGVSVVRDGHESISSGYERHLEGTLAIVNKIAANTSLDEAKKNDAINSQYRYIAFFLAKRCQGEKAREYLHKVNRPQGIRLLLNCYFCKQIAILRSIVKRLIASEFLSKFVGASCFR